MGLKAYANSEGTMRESKYPQGATIQSVVVFMNFVKIELWLLGKKDKMHRIRIK